MEDNKNIGCLNNWDKKTPEEFINCQVKLKHRAWEKNLGRCYNEYGCDICKIKWQVDSSD